jgi:hypothetical protein
MAGDSAELAFCFEHSGGPAQCHFAGLDGRLAAAIYDDLGPNIPAMSYEET